MLTDAQLQQALSRLGLGTLLGAEPIGAGNFGQNLFLTSTQGLWVLRGAPFWPWQFRKERLLTDLLHAHTSAPVPWPYRVVEDPSILGWPYVIMPRMPGLHTDDPAVSSTLGPTDRLGIADALGRGLAALHGLEWPYSSAYDPPSGTLTPLGCGWHAWVAGRIRRNVAAAARTSERTTDDDMAWAERVIADAQAAAEEPFAPCFVMEDYKEGNTVLRRTAGGWEVSGVFDYMPAYMGDGEVDLSRQVCVYLDEDAALAHAFLRAYSSARHPRSGWRERYRLYMLLDRSIIWEFAQRVGVWWNPSLTLRGWAEPYVEHSLPHAEPREDS